MRRQDIQLLALARKGDAAARSEAGRRYLTGAPGFPRHVRTGIDYLTHPSVTALPAAGCLIAECLTLDELVVYQQVAALKRAAASDSARAQAKLAIWIWLRCGHFADVSRLLSISAEAGYPPARLALAALEPSPTAHALVAVLRIFSDSRDMDGPTVAMLAARSALADKRLSQLSLSLSMAVLLASSLTNELAQLIAGAVHLSVELAVPLTGRGPDSIEKALETCASRGDHGAAYTLGRALCGLPVGAIGARNLTNASNLRKGVGMLLRAADAGREDAWLHLHRVHGDRNSSVCNPQMARFYLEKAARAGLVDAQRRLGALLLRSSETVEQSERAIEWLHRAASEGDLHAPRLLRSLVLPLGRVRRSI